MKDVADQLSRCASIFERLSQVMRKEEDGIARNQLSLTGQPAKERERGSDLLLAEARQCQAIADRLKTTP